MGLQMAWAVSFSKVSTYIWASARDFVTRVASQWKIIYYHIGAMVAEESEGKLLILNYPAVLTLAFYLS